MMFTNLIADFIVRFNTGLKNNSNFIFIPYSKINLQLLWLLMGHGCIHFFFIDIDPVSSTLRIKVVFKFAGGRSVIDKLSIVSKPGLRVYWTVSELANNVSRNTFQGFYLVSTSMGLCTSSELVLLKTLDKRMSGEVIMKVMFH